MKFNRIVEIIGNKWSRSVPGCVIDTTSAYHLVILENILDSLKVPSKDKIRILNHLRCISEAKADVIAPTLKQAKDRADDGQTYSSPRSQKTYKKGEEAENDNVDDTSSPNEIPSDKKQNTAFKDVDSNGNEIIRDKTLSKVSDEIENKVFNSNSSLPDDETFESTSRNFKASKTSKPIDITNPPPPFVLPDGLSNISPKVPKKYLTVIERMVNTKKIDKLGFTPSISHFMAEGGAGRITAQAGEILTLIMAGMTDEQLDIFQNSLNNHLENPNRSKRQIIDKSWVQAAVNNRKAIFNRIQKKYPNIKLPTAVVHSAWDTETDVEGLGLSDYKKNKGYSTDIYLKLQTPNGVILDEVSLKKDKNINFLNSGTGMFKTWDPNLPDNINQEKYRLRARQRNIDFVGSKMAKIKKLVVSNKELRDKVKSKGYSIENAATEGGSHRDKNSILWTAVKALASSGDKEAIAVMRRDELEHKKFISDSVDAIMNNKKMYNGMMREIKSEFPLKAIATQEESMAIGDQSLDKDTMQKIFGTGDYEKIKDGLVTISPTPITKNGKPVYDKKTGKQKMSAPYMGYRAKVGSDVIPISTISIREDGRGYGGQFKFEMKMDQRFYKILEQANKAVYSN
jgi:hypothetical protein